MGQGDEYLVVDETAAPGLRYSYWVEVLDPLIGVDPPAGTLLFRTNVRTVEPAIVSVEAAQWRQRPILSARPNPSNGDVDFTLGRTRDDCVLEVFDVRGRLVWKTGTLPRSDTSSTAVRWSAHATGAPHAGVFWARASRKEGGTIATTKVILVP